MKEKKRINIFIVEDNKVFALALKASIETAFSTMPLQIHLFETGETCMKKFTEIKPKVVILDYLLNSKFVDAMDGIRVLNLIKKESPDTNVIMLTRDDNIDIALKSFKHGASDYVVKSDTQSRKIIFSLFNLFKIMKAKEDSKRYKNILIATSLGIAIIFGMLIAMGFFNPFFLFHAQ